LPQYEGGAAFFGFLSCYLEKERLKVPAVEDLRRNDAPEERPVFASLSFFFTADLKACSTLSTSRFVESGKT
jgi:hypothetical protein